jgi:hypothetical protein
MVGLTVVLLPQPKHAVHVAVMEEEDRIHAGGVILTHVAICISDLSGRELCRNIEPTDRQMDVIVGGFQ